jgi:protein O-GlcNAc transferase
VGRAGLSQLSNLGLSELAVATDEQFVRTACEWAADIGRLSQLRRTLRGRMITSPLMDARRFARGMEEAYRGMWQRWCGLAKASQ